MTRREREAVKAIRALRAAWTEYIGHDDTEGTEDLDTITAAIERCEDVADVLAGSVSAPRGGKAVR